jgi:hypothetical protein
VLLDGPTLAGIEAGRVTVAFRRWRRPTVKAGGTLLTAIGQLAIDGVEPVDEAALTTHDALAAGFDDLSALRAALAVRSEGDVYRITLRHAGPDPRIALREDLPDDDELLRLIDRLVRWDRASARGAWTRATLALIQERPGVRAADLAKVMGVETPPFKVDVRKLKGLGLTESLEVGYRLSRRGRAVLDRLERGAGGERAGSEG